MEGHLWEKLCCSGPDSERKNHSHDLDLLRDMRDRMGESCVDWDLVKPPPAGLIVDYDGISQPSHKESKLVVVRLNGGLGTTMGCDGPKALIELHKNQTFMDLAVAQIEQVSESNDGVKVPLIFMNSFWTTRETEQAIERNKEKYSIKIQMFEQSRFPRLDGDTLNPIPQSYEECDQSNWYPPGHGEFYNAFRRSGLMEMFRKAGKQYVFVSNMDNVGALVDAKILHFMASNKVDFVMEVTNKTAADVKGGTLIQYEGHPMLLEVAQVPPDKLSEFKSMRKFKIFNTNNVWISLDAIDKMPNITRDLDVIVNKKEVNGRKIVQLETAIGAAVRQFHHVCGINVPRTRFLSVKSTNDLLLLQSNVFELNAGRMMMNPKRPLLDAPTVRLGEYFKAVRDYKKRLKGIPDLLELESLTVSGDVSFGSNVVLRGTVIITAQAGQHIDIPACSELENAVVMGNLAIRDL